MKIPLFARAGIFPGGIGLGAALFAVAVSSAPGAVSPARSVAYAALEAHARGVLHQIMDTEDTWIRIHAAEALMAAGESEQVRADFLRRLPEFESSKIRIGVWRVLTTTSHTPEERAGYIAKIEAVYLDPAAADRPQAIETLCKLAHKVTGPALALVRREAAGAPSVQMSLALWSAQLAGEPKALEGLTALLACPDAELRADAAYALRWLHLSDPAMRNALARAAAAEPVNSSAYATILGATISTGAANPEEQGFWVVALDRVFTTGKADARFEASWTLKRLYEPADLPHIAAFLDLPATENVARVGTASVILTALAHK